MDIEIIYSDLFFRKDESYKYAKGLYWKYSRESISSISKCINKVDGIIFLSVFPCGLDSLVNELVMRKLDKPYINLVIDDIESSGGIETRIESFIDIINSK
jgi:predicted nucleotide-binding protein (sugar kinase/HSP70/actin superfamily)